MVPRLPRVAVVTRFFNKQGGVSNVTAQLAERAQKSGRFDVTVFSNEFLDWDEGSGLKRVFVPMLRRPKAAQVATFSLNAKRLVESERWDLVHVHDSQMFGADLYTAHSCYNSYIAARRGTAGPLASLASRLYPGHLWRLQNERLVYKSARRAIVAVSGSVEDQIRQVIRPGAPVSHIYNGVDLTRYAAASDSKALRDIVGSSVDDSLKVIFVGSEFDRKGLDVALKAFAELRADARLFVVGGDDSTPYVRLARNLKVDHRVHFLGHRTDVPSLLAASDVFLFPTRYEAASLAILEALSSQLAVVTTDQAMAGEVLVDGESALLVPNDGRHESVAYALQLLAETDGLVERLKAGGRAVAESFSWDAVWRRYEVMYDELISG